MPLFWKPYRSQVTDFIASLKQQRPTLEAEQRAGRGLLWDRSQNREQAADAAAAKVPQAPYVYQTEPLLDPAVPTPVPALEPTKPPANPSAP